MTAHALPEETINKYAQLMNETNLQLTTQEVYDLLEYAKQYLEQIARAEACGLSSREEAIQSRVMFRNAAKRLLGRALDLEDAAKQALVRFIREQPEFLAGEYKFTADFFSQHKEIWACLLSRFAHRPNLNFLEIGSFEGASACWLLKNILTHSGSRLTCIDTFDFAGQGTFCLQDGGLESMAMEDRFDFNIKQAGGAAKVRKIVEYSHVALRPLPLASFDFIYIDGSHKAMNVLEDAVLCWPLLKQGGLLTFDDYEWDGDPDPLNLPKPAIDAFLDVYQGHYELIHQAYQITLEKL